MNTDNPQALEALLPWLANDTLTDEEDAACREYASSDRQGSQGLTQLRRLSEEMRTDEFEAPGEDLAWARLKREIKNDKSPTGRQRISRLRVATSIAAMLVIGVPLTPLLMPAQQAPGFTTLSSPTKEQQPASDEVALRLVVAPMEAAALSRFLEARQAKLIRRSTVSGVLIIHVPANAEFSNPAAWQSEDEVQFAERLQ